MYEKPKKRDFIVPSIGIFFAIMLGFVISFEINNMTKTIVAVAYGLISALFAGNLVVLIQSFIQLYRYKHRIDTNNPFVDV